MKKIVLFIIMLGALCACSGGGEYEEMRQRLHSLNMLNRADSVLTATERDEAQALVDYFDSHGTPNDQMLAYYLLGRAFYDCSELPDALEAYHSAAACADTTHDDCDYRTLCRVHAQMAEIFHQHYQPRTAIAELLEAQRMAYKDKDTLMAIECFLDQSNEYERLGEADTAYAIVNFQ